MAEFFSVFVLAHLTGDFVLQTDKLAYLKSKGLKGLLIHCAIVSAVQVLMMSLFGVNGILAAIVVSLIHFPIDCLKLILNKLTVRYQALYFLADQAAHLLTIWAFTLIFASGPVLKAELLTPAKYLIGFIIATYVSSVFAKILVRDIFPDIRQDAFFKKNERTADMISGFVFFAAFFLSPMFCMVVILIAAFLYFVFQKRIWHYPNRVLAAKLASVMICAYLAGRVAL